MTASWCAISCDVACQSFHYNRPGGKCETFIEGQLDHLVTVSDTEWTVGYKIQQMSVMEANWTLVFRAQKAIGVATYDTWVDSSRVDDYPILSTFPEACLRFSDYNSCDRHFRSHILNNWTNVDEVRLALYKSDAEVAFITFDGVGSDRDSWFSVDRILNTTWAPAIFQEPWLSYFGVSGFFIQGTLNRRFYIAFNDGCDLDVLYTMTIDQSFDTCSDREFWNITWDSFPCFLYSPVADRAAPHNDANYTHSEQADVLAIWVTFL